MSNFLILAVLLAGVLISPTAAAAIDMSAVTTALTTDLTGSLVTVGGVLLIAAATAVTFKWIKRDAVWLSQGKPVGAGQPALAFSY